MPGHMQSTWIMFLDALRDEILPVYRQHELSFDQSSIHGRMHICRCALFAEFMCRYYQANTRYSPKFEQVRYAIAFHDAGREGNGVDQWEQQSARLCRDFVSQRMTSDEAHEVQRCIPKQDSGDWSLEKRIVHDADVLDIMRPCCGHGGRDGFRESALRFLGKREFPPSGNDVVRNKLIDEAWCYIQFTEQQKSRLVSTTDYMAEMLTALGSLKTLCPLLTEYLLDSTSM